MSVVDICRLFNFGALKLGAAKKLSLVRPEASAALAHSLSVAHDRRGHTLEVEALRDVVMDAMLTISSLLESIPTPAEPKTLPEPPPGLDPSQVANWYHIQHLRRATSDE